jgi:hypothetical protein
MKSNRWRALVVAAAGAAVLLGAMTRPARAQSTSKGITLYEDVKTGALYRTPARGRVKVVLGADTPPAEDVHQQIQQAVKKNDDELRSEFMQNQQELLKQNADLKKQVGEMKPAWTDYMDNFKNKFHIGTLVYADWRLYTHTSFGPQELTQINSPGPGNELYNSFDISRAYINFFFNPTDDWTIRVTPNIYRMNGTATADSFGRSSSIGSNLSGNLGYRLKYGYLQYSKAFDNIDAMKGDTITGGAIPNPIVAWEEDLYGFRYVNLTPWNYLSLSSTQMGISVQGPIKFNELQYVDYDFGVYGNNTFHAFEQTNTKQVMGRVSVYPFGAKWRFDGLGLTGFYDYGYGNTTPDFVGGSPFFNAPKAHITRAAALIHYTAEQWGLAGEWDYGHNAFTSGNLFSSSAPSTTGPWANFGTLASALLNNGRSVQQGFDVFGHVHIPNTPFTLFGLFEWFQPNTNVDVNPLDFERYVAGISYQYNEFLRFSLDTQNLMYYHSQFAFPASEAHSFAPVTFSPKTLASVASAVPRDEHAFFLNAEFAF